MVTSPLLLPPSLASLANLEAILTFLTPSPAWTPFWYSLYDGGGAVALLWVQVYLLSPRRTEIAFELAGLITIHLTRILTVAWFACYRNDDGWTEAAVTRCLGMVIVLGLDWITIRRIYWRQPAQERRSDTLPSVGEHK
ncbi:uncharacterized protein BO66DRAFT_426528 [Aspergillus aculeatinus CBS 121060]|uniref:Uncharacterized protein n=1 Tax=Aspergillus aculeatinus CBS 121060 TaxID=1448322 RepID=A0ACD1HI66_9EURO|nr:hypothetical protein BO66DRAFT_426528 [Aspergillus aculeatinus CBS 121060]RAH73107.1 hypothetical protein BO66DRAFT_426528 [Aspergillus aculeatinus CBS 121060]